VFTNILVTNYFLLPIFSPIKLLKENFKKQKERNHIRLFVLDSLLVPGIQEKKIKIH